jgi:signal transduction histidine kinase
VFFVGLQLAVIGLAYYWALQLGLAFRYTDSQTGIIWPSNALLLAALLLTPRRRWVAVVAVTAISHIVQMSDSIPIWRALWQAGTNTAFALATVETLRRVAGLPLLFDSARQVFVYLAVALVLPAVSALPTAGFVRSVLDLDPGHRGAPSTLIRIGLSNTTAMLLFVPVVLVWAHAGISWLRQLSWRRALEASVILGWLIAVSAVAFGGHSEVAQISWLLPWTFPPLLWAALRFGPVGASTSVFCVVALSIWGTARRLGPFVPTTGADQVYSLQLFWIGLCPPVMLLAAVTRERERAEDALLDQRRQLTRAARIAMASELSGALAHELSQPLASSLSDAQSAGLLLRQDPPNVSEARNAIGNVVEQNRAAASVLRRLRSLLQADDSRFEPLAIENVMRDALTLSRGWASVAGVEIHTEAAAVLPPVLGDPVQLLQVLLNLIVNGCESMAGVAPAERRLRVSVLPAGDNRVQVVVQDRGVGLPMGHEEFVFKPFFTTKPDGLGLGLAIARTIVGAHGGQLVAENNPAGGATFRMTLPVCEPPDVARIPRASRFRLSRIG